MNNRDIYSSDPSRKLINEGVAYVNDDQSENGLRVLRYELETFVCDGQYQDGLERILNTYLKNLKEAQQPAVWVSGFYGSGKSHLVKMLRALWENTEFADGKKARAIADLPPSVKECLHELSTTGQRYGGLRAASGTLGSASSSSVRLALLSIVFRSVGLPQQYPRARFVLWLKKEGLLEQARKIVGRDAAEWDEELDNLYVAESLHRALVELRPQTFPTVASCAETLRAQYPHVEDISTDDLVRVIRQALSKDDVLPLTLIILDEVQQYIGESSERSLDIQEAVEACCKQIGSKLLFIGTGQTAVTGTSNLKKLEGRFTVRVELSDTDVDSVVRKVVLAKKSTAKPSIEQVMDKNSGEISRHLTNSTIGHRQADAEFFTQDYPILPVRRRFWENTLRVLDQTGTDSQLRNQLSMVHRAIQTNLDEPLGHVIPADYLYFDSADKLLQMHVLPRKVHERTMTWIKGSPDERLMARAAGIVFLINRISGRNKELGLRADADTIADLLVEDLNEGSSSLRSRLVHLMDHCELLMKVGEEYRIQTEESAAWNDEYESQRNQLANESHSIEAERNTRIRKKFSELVPKKDQTVLHGNSKTPRDIHPIFESQLPADANTRIYAWIRDGWSVDENTVRADAREAGHQSPTIFVFVPRRSADDLRTQLINCKAATATLDKRGNPTTPEGIEARAAIETIQKRADGRIQELLGEAYANARVFSGGGDEVTASNLAAAIRDAAETGLHRLYPRFSQGDHEGWSKVYSSAAKGAADALTSIGFQGEPQGHLVCQEIQRSIGAGKTGKQVHSEFESTPYGWPRDTVDGGLQVLLVAGLVRAQDERGQTTAPNDLERRQIGNTTFKIEATTISKAQIIQIRKLFQAAGIVVRPDEEKTRVRELLELLETRANQAGGEPPQPARPDTTFLEPVRTTSGNEQLMALYERRDDITAALRAWQAQANHVSARLPKWQALQELLRYADALQAADEIRREVQAICDQRLLLDNPDPVPVLSRQLEDILRQHLLTQQDAYNQMLKVRRDELERDHSWAAISAVQRRSIEESNQIDQPMALDVSDRRSLVRTMDEFPLSSWKDRIDALGSRFDRARGDAARLLAPQAQTVHLTRPTLQSEAELNVWLNALAAEIRAALARGPVMLK